MHRHPTEMLIDCGDESTYLQASLLQMIQRQGGIFPTTPTEIGFRMDIHVPKVRRKSGLNDYCRFLSSSQPEVFTEQAILMIFH